MRRFSCAGFHAPVFMRRFSCAGFHWRARTRNDRDFTGQVQSVNQIDARHPQAARDMLAFVS
jgi:hypothetical protein